MAVCQLCGGECAGCMSKPDWRAVYAQAQPSTSCGLTGGGKIVAPDDCGFGESGPSRVPGSASEEKAGASKPVNEGLMRALSRRSESRRGEFWEGDRR